MELCENLYCCRGSIRRSFAESFFHVGQSECRWIVASKNHHCIIRSPRDAAISLLSTCANGYRLTALDRGHVGGSNLFSDNPCQFSSLTLFLSFFFSLSLSLSFSSSTLFLLGYLQNYLLQIRAQWSDLTRCIILTRVQSYVSLFTFLGCQPPLLFSRTRFFLFLTFTPMEEHVGGSTIIFTTNNFQNWPREGGEMWNRAIP